MIVLKDDCFNTLYLKALKIAISGAKCYQKAYFEIMPDDPRLIFLNHRKINPIFAIIEGVWVLAGSNKLAPLLNELPNFGAYSDDGETLNGAYGDRLRNYFGFDQINVAIDALKNDYFTRRVVLTLFSPSDLKINSLDIPCNTEIYLKITNNAVDITVLNRSNDLYLGLPYNVFVFGLLQKYVSLKLNLSIGIQRHFTDSLHIYEKNIDATKLIVKSNNIEAVSVISNNFNWE
jgi:thymidylate synthase